MDEEGRRVPVIAKIEKPQAVDHLEEIMEAFDGFMIARGDLGVEMPLEQVPLVQKRAIALARRNAKPVIVATQMLETMISASRPTRAEVSDCANAVLDGADALMLSGETSVGVHPSLTVQTMARIISTVESDALDTIPVVVGKARTKGGAIATGGGRRRCRPRCALPRRVHRDGRQCSPVVAVPVGDSRCWRSAGRLDPQPAGAHVGRRNFPGGAGVAHRPDGQAGRRALLDLGGCRSANSS